MSKQREAFEEFWRREMNVKVMDLARTAYPMTAPEAQAYKSGETDRGWMAWQASRAAALEDAIGICEGYAAEAAENAILEGDDRFKVYAKKYRWAASGIRALKEKS